MEIGIIKPLLDGFDVMKAVLFRPFDLRKWLAIGFAAFLTGHFGGGGSGFNFNPWRSAEKRHVERPFHIPGWEHWRPWLPLIVLLVFTFMLALVVFFMWLSARGTFVFTDCIVRNRGAVGAPWREYRQEGNSLFGFRLAISAASVVAVMLILGLFLSFSAIVGGGGIANPMFFVLLFLCWIVLAIVLGLIMYFVPMVMYRQRCSATDGFREVTRLLCDHPWSFVLFAMAGVLLLMCATVVGTLAMCLTCCLAALPYIGTVLLLPVFVWLRAFGLLFFRQFGSDHDVWAVVTPPSELPPSPNVV